MIADALPHSRGVDPITSDWEVIENALSVSGLPTYSGIEGSVDIAVPYQDNGATASSQLICIASREGEWPQRYLFPQSAIPAGHRAVGLTRSRRAESLLTWWVIHHLRS